MIRSELSAFDVRRVTLAHDGLTSIVWGACFAHCSALADPLISPTRANHGIEEPLATVFGSSNLQGQVRTNHVASDFLRLSTPRPLPDAYGRSHRVNLTPRQCAHDTSTTAATGDPPPH